MSRFDTRIPVRWADLDAFRHVNHARTVTLLEEARVELVFRRGAERGAGAWTDGLLVASLEVQYKNQIPYRGQSVLVSIWVHQVRAASFLLDYELRVGPEPSDSIAVTARTTMVPFDLVAGRPRRLTEAEREFLALWTDGEGDARVSEVRAG
jgi:acyl-CoA thioester hydrolase